MRKIPAGVVAVTMAIGVGAIAMAQAAASPTYSSSLARAPYVTDLTQTTAEVNWGTTISSAAGSVQWVDAGTTSCAGVSWATWSSARSHASASTQVPYGTATIGWGYSVDGVKEYQNSAQMTGLVAGHTYCYAVYTGKTSGTDLLASPAYRSVTTLQPASASKLSFDVIGDTGENFAQTSPSVVAFPGSPTSNPYQSKLYSEIGADYASGKASFLLGAGDTSYNGGTQNTYGDLTHTGTAATDTGSGATEYSNIFGPGDLPMAGGIPTYLADGNHGQNNYGLRFFPAQASARASGGSYQMTSYNVDGVSGSFPDDWYAFSTGGVRIYVLDAAWSDTQIGTASSMYQVDSDAHWQASSPEMKWLKNDLATHGGVKMAVFHYPLESDTTTENTDTYLDQNLEPVLAQGGVSLVFNGHAHTYQRFIPTAPGQLPSYVTGGGGGVPESVNANGSSMCSSEEQSAAMYAIGWSPSKGGGTYCGQGPAPTLSDVGDVYSYLRVTVSGGLITVNGVNADGGTFDTQTYGSSSGGGGSTTTTTSSTSTTTTTGVGTPPPNQVSFIQAATSNTKAVSLPAPTKQDDTLVLSASLYTGATNQITGITGGGSWTRVADANTSGHISDGEIWVASNVPAGLQSFTVTTAAASTALGLQEFSGLGTPKVTDGSTSTTSSSAAWAQSGSGSVAVGYVAGHANGQTLTPTTGFVNQPQATTTGSIASLVTGYLLNPSNPDYSATFGTAMYWSAGVVILTTG